MLHRHDGSDVLKRRDVVVTHEVYVAKYKVTVNAKGEIIATEFIRNGWFPEEETRRPSVPGIFYVAATDEFARNNMTIRQKQENNRGHRQAPS
jgi:hypothetical protein